MNEELLIANTTREERQWIVNESLGIIDGTCDGCAPGIISMYDDYIEGKKELVEVNAEFRGHYVLADPRMDEDQGMSCML